MKAITFIRGQVWYWEDPVFGRKENNISVPIGESSIRYSRYCIIIQDTNTITNDSILVIPCSSTNDNEHDVTISLHHLFNDKYTYAKTRAIYPVHPRYLKSYVCTLPEEIMLDIDAQLLKIALPTVTNALSNDQIKALFNIDMKKSNIIVKPNDNDIEVSIRSFIRDCIINGDNTDVIKPRELKHEFDQYCIINQIPLIDDIIEFIDRFTYVVNGKSYNLTDKFNYNIMEFKGIKIRRLKLSIDVNTDQVNDSDKVVDSNIPKTNLTSRWGDSAILEFLQYYHNNGLTSTCEKFELKPSTVTTYWNRWRNRIDPEMNNITFPNNISEIPTTSEIQNSVSKVANMIRETLISDDIFSLLGDVSVSIGKSKSRVINAEEFYSKLGTSVYFSLLDFLGIVNYDWANTCYIPKLDRNSKYLNTWHFFDKIYNDRRVSMEKDGTTMMELYRQYYSDINTGIDIEWLPMLGAKINNRLYMSDDALNLLCNRIRDIYCKIV